MRSIEDQLTGPEPEQWEPEEGDSILGEIEAISEREGEYGPFKVVTLLDKDEQPWNVACFGTVLSNKIEELRPQIGDQLGVKYLGQREPKGGGKPYHDWRVVIKRTDSVVTPAAAEALVGASFEDDDASI